jgi:phospholipid/cholesterol/gamma-HCH transport system substrate-binding protein
MSQNRNALIGLFVLGGLTALGVLIVRFGEASWLFSKGYNISAQFKTVTGVREGTQVELSGVPVGRVTSLDLVDLKDPTRGVMALLEIDRHYLVPEGSLAIVRTPLMGQPVIDIEPPLDPSVPLPTDGGALIEGKVKNPLESVIEPRFMSSLEKTTIQIGELAAALKPAAGAMKDILEQRTIRQVETSTRPGETELTANLYTAVQRLHSVLKHFDVVLGDPEVQSNIKLSLDNFRAASDEIRLAAGGFREFSASAVQVGQNVEQLTGKLDQTLTMTHERIDTLGASLIDNSNKLSKLLDQFSSVGQDLAEGQGTMGMLLRDPKLYDEIMLTVRRLGLAASEMTVLVKQWQKQGILGM